MKEIVNTLEEQGLEVDTRHIMLVADLMTSKGYLQQMADTVSLELRLRFLRERRLKLRFLQLQRRSLEGQIETLRGVTENVIVGATVPVGTGMVDLYMKVREGNGENARETN